MKFKFVFPTTFSALSSRLQILFGRVFSQRIFISLASVTRMETIHQLFPTLPASAPSTLKLYFLSQAINIYIRGQWRTQWRIIWANGSILSTENLVRKRRRGLFGNAATFKNFTTLSRLISNFLFRSKPKGNPKFSCGPQLTWGLLSPMCG